MPAIDQLRSGLRVGYAHLGEYGEGVGTPRQMVHDGDTITVDPKGNLGVRFLGVDAPEVSFTLPGGTNFVPITDRRWETFLTNPLDPQLPPFDPDVSHWQNVIDWAQVAASGQRFADR